MSQELTKIDTSVSKVFAKESVQERFKQLLGKKTQGFITSVLQSVQANKELVKANPQTVLTAAATAAALDLPVNQNLGYSWIVPYKGEAQFQMGWKGYVQLALRTGQYKRINAVEVYENQYRSWNSMTEELDADFDVEGSGKVVGYVAYFRLTNGFEKTVFWTKTRVQHHAKKYSKAYSSKYSPWQDEGMFDAMAKKTVLKNALSKWGILSIELQQAIQADQSVQSDEGNYQYPDNQTLDLEELNKKEEVNRIKSFIKKTKTEQELKDLREMIGSDFPKECEADYNNQMKVLEEEVVS